MRCHSDAVKVAVRSQMSDTHGQNVDRISKELGIHVIAPYRWRTSWQLQGEVVPASEKDLEGWGATDKFRVVLVTAGLNANQLSTCCRSRSVPRAGRTFLAGIPGCQQQTSAHF
jgi:hypothetical protein